MKASRWSCWATIGLAFAWVSPGVAQPTFVEVTPPNDPLLVTPETDDFWINAVAPADVDLDGDLDLAILGYYVVYDVSAVDRLVLLKNDGPDADGNWQFTHQEVPLGDLFAGASDLAWGDVDADGDFDLAVGSEGATVVYRNDTGALVPLATPAPLPGYYEDSTYSGAYDLRSLAWGDYDGDGDQDLLVPSVFDFDLFEYSTKLLRNDGPDGTGGWLFVDAAAGFAATVHAQSGWADDDADGDLDLLLVNVDPFTETGFVNRYENVAGAFVESSLLDIRVQWGLADWGDADADGDFDLLVAGNIEEADLTFDTVLRVYRNDGGVYTPETLIDAPNADWLDIHAATWADYDSDGDVDLLLTGNFVGEGEIVGHSRIFANEGGAYVQLALELPAPIDSIVAGGAFTWLDIDGDADLDYFVAGAYFVPGGNGLVEAQAHLYRNGESTLNGAPLAPPGLVATPGADGVTLSWLAASDEETPAAALTYELALRSSGAAVAAGKRLPEPGNLGPSTQFLLRNLDPGVYHWSVRAVDGAYEGGVRAGGSFAVPGGNLLFFDGFEAGNLGAWTGDAP
jgi:hypothetical protein